MLSSNSRERSIKKIFSTLQSFIRKVCSAYGRPITARKLAVSQWVREKTSLTIRIIVYVRLRTGAARKQSTQQA